MITYPNLYHLKYFVDAVELGSISGAAQKNLVTHPAISRAITALEKHLSTPLLIHQKKSFKVTVEGYNVAEQAKTLLVAASDFGSLSMVARKEEPGELKIAVSRSLTDRYLFPLLQHLKVSFPNAKTHVQFGTTHEIIEAVANGSVDLGLTIGTLNLPTLKQTLLSEGQFVLVESSEKKDLKRNPKSRAFIITEPRLETEKLKASYHKHFGVPLPVLFEVSSWDVIGQLVQKGFGIGLLPELSLAGFKKGTFKISNSFDFECSYAVYAHTLKSSAQNRLLNFARDILIKNFD